MPADIKRLIDVSSYPADTEVPWFATCRMRQVRRARQQHRRAAQLERAAVADEPDWKGVALKGLGAGLFTPWSEQPFPRWDLKVEYPGGHDEENENHNHNTGGETQLVDECAHEEPRLDTDDALPGSIYAGRSEGSYVTSHSSAGKPEPADSAQCQRVDIIRKRAEHLGTVEAATEKEAIEKAAERFEIPTERRNRIAVQKMGKDKAGLC